MAQLKPIQVRRDTSANWTSVNPVLLLGEPGLETDTKKVKYGDGTTAWNSLPYSSGTVSFGTTSGTAAQGNDSRITGAAQRTGGNSFTGQQDFSGAQVVGLPTGTPQFGTVLGKSSGNVTGADVVAVAEVSAALGAKANTSDVNTALGAKANSADVSTALAALPGTYANRTEQLKAWALTAAFTFSAAPTANSAGTITGGSIVWPDGATGVFTATSTDANGAITAFTATTTGGPLGSKTVTVTVPRDANSIINGAMTVTVS